MITLPMLPTRVTSLRFFKTTAANGHPGHLLPMSVAKTPDQTNAIFHQTEYEVLVLWPKTPECLVFVTRPNRMSNHNYLYGLVETAESLSTRLSLAAVPILTLKKTPRSPLTEPLIAALELRVYTRNEESTRFSASESPLPFKRGDPLFEDCRQLWLADTETQTSVPVADWRDVLMQIFPLPRLTAGGRRAAAWKF